MAFCGKCGQKVEEGVKFCPACGAPLQVNTAQPANETVQQPTPQPTPQTVQTEGQETTAKATAAADTLGNKLGNLHNTTDSTADFDKADIEQNKVMAILSYFGILVFIPIFAAKGSKFARYHANQGLALFIAMIGWWIVDYILTMLLRSLLWRGLGLWEIYSLCGTVLNLVYIVFTVLAVIGIINALNGKAKELPVIGKYKILK
ncbi:zinc-ribbon domain-containing protein [Phocaeicola sp.]